MWFAHCTACGQFPPHFGIQPPQNASIHTAGCTLHNNHLSPNTIPSYFTHNSTPSLKLSQSYYVSYYNAAVCMMLYLAINTKTAKHCIINYNASDWDALSRHQCIDIMFKRSLYFHFPQSRAVMQWRFCLQEPVHPSGSASGHSPLPLDVIVLPLLCRLQIGLQQHCCVRSSLPSTTLQRNACCNIHWLGLAARHRYRLQSLGSQTDNGLARIDGASALQLFLFFQQCLLPNSLATH